MHYYTPEAADAIESSERRFVHNLWVDWNNNGRYDHPLSNLSQYATETNRDQTLTSTAPEEVQLVDGYAAGKFTAVITGEYEGMSLAAHFAPNNGRSIFYTEGIALGVRIGYSINVETANGWEVFVQFEGIVRDVIADREAGEVRIEALDNTELMRTKTRVPAYGMLTRYLVNGYKRGLLVDSSSVIDLAARSGGFSAGPVGYDRFRDDPLRQCVVSVPFHGSILPEIGSLDNVEEFHLTEDWEKDAALKPRAEQYTAGPWGQLALNAVPRGKNSWAVKKFWAETAVLEPYDRRVWGTSTLAVWLYWTGNGVDESSTVVEMFDTSMNLQLIVEASNGGVCARTVAQYDGAITDGHWLFMGEPGWYFLEAGFDLYPGRDVVMRTRVNDTVSPVVTRPYRPRDTAVDHAWQNLVTATNKYALSDLAIMRTPYTGDLAANITYDTGRYNNAAVSWGRNRVTYTLRDSGREAWDLAKEVASAEYGAVFFDEWGRFIFWNYEDITARQSTAVRTFTVDDLESLNLRTTMDSVRNVWRATTKVGRSEPGIAYDLAKDDLLYWKRENTGEYFPSEMVINPGEWEGWFPNKPEVMSVNPNRMPLMGNDIPFQEHWPLRGFKTFQGTTYVGWDVEIVSRNTSRDWTKVDMWNPNGGAVGFHGPNDSKWFRADGTLVREEPERSWEVRSGSSVAEYGERILELNNNFWLQDEFQTRNMLQAIVDRIARPIPVSDTVTVPGDPRVQLGDTIEVRDADGFGEFMWLQVLGIKRSFGDDGLTDTYTVEMVLNPGEGVWDSPTYGLWDQSFIWS